MCNKMSYFRRIVLLFSILLSFSKIGQISYFLTLHLSFLSLGESRDDKADRECARAEHYFPGYWVVFLLYFSFFDLSAFISALVNTKSGFFFSHALRLNKPIKAVEWNLWSLIKLRTGKSINTCKLGLLLVQERINNFLVVILVSHRNKEYARITALLPFSNHLCFTSFCTRTLTDTVQHLLQCLLELCSYVWRGNFCN